jgi:hypothetical protein
VLVGGVGDAEAAFPGANGRIAFTVQPPAAGWIGVARGAWHMFVP